MQKSNLVRFRIKASAFNKIHHMCVAVSIYFYNDILIVFCSTCKIKKIWGKKGQKCEREFFGNDRKSQQFVWSSALIRAV